MHGSFIGLLLFFITSIQCLNEDRHTLELVVSFRTTAHRLMRKNIMVRSLPVLPADEVEFNDAPGPNLIEVSKFGQHRLRMKRSPRKRPCWRQGRPRKPCKFNYKKPPPPVPTTTNNDTKSDPNNAKANATKTGPLGRSMAENEVISNLQGRSLSKSSSAGKNGTKSIDDEYEEYEVEETKDVKKKT